MAVPHMPEFDDITYDMLGFPKIFPACDAHLTDLVFRSQENLGCPDCVRAREKSERFWAASVRRDAQTKEYEELQVKKKTFYNRFVCLLRGHIYERFNSSSLFRNQYDDRIFDCQRCGRRKTVVASAPSRITLITHT